MFPNQQLTAPEALEQPEEWLVAACRRGDRNALDQVLRSYAPLLERQILRLSGAASDTPDLLQEALMRAVRSFPSYRGEATLRTWLTRIAIRVVQDHFRQPRRERPTAFALDGSDDVRIATGLGPDRVVESRRQLERLVRHLERLNPTNRLAYILYEVDGLPIPEVARALRISRVAAKSRVFLARRALMKATNRDPLLHDLGDMLWDT